MDRGRQRSDDDDHFAALRKLDTVQLMYRGRIARARAVRSLYLRTGRQLHAIARQMSSRLALWLRHGELAHYDDRLLRDMGITRYDVRVARRSVTETIALWLDRSRQRQRLARFTERDLHDVAISKCDADAEIAKPFWRA